MNPKTEGDKTRRKRLKVVSACCECRRKKTKCNGEAPCSGCIKAHVECKYNCPPKSTPPIHLNPPMEPVKKLNVIHHLSKQRKSPVNSIHRIHQSIESIEERLGAIENILRALLGSGKNKYLLQGLHQKSETPCKSDPQLSDHDSSDLNAKTTPSISPHVNHPFSPLIQNRKATREKRPRQKDDEDVTNIRDDFGHGYFESRPKYRLAPIFQEHKVRPSISGTSSIQSLLNEEVELDDLHSHSPYRFYDKQSSPHTTHSAFKRMVVHLPSKTLINSETKII